MFHMKNLYVNFSYNEQICWISCLGFVSCKEKMPNIYEKK